MPVTEPVYAAHASLLKNKAVGRVALRKASRWLMLRRYS